MPTSLPKKFVKPVPDIMDPAQKSVFDPLYVTLMRRATGLLGLDDPNNVVTDQLSPMGVPASPLISIFKNKVAREAGTEAALQKAKRLPPRFRQGFNELAKKYPRIAAHMDPKSIQNDFSQMPYTTGYIRPVPGKVKAPIEVGIPPYGQQLSQMGEITDQFEQLGLPMAKDVMRHEATHVAQSLGSKDHKELYGLAHKLMGYQNNPYEVSARGITKGIITAPDALEGYAKQVRNELATQLPSPENNKQLDLADQILTILNARKGQGWRPSTNPLPRFRNVKK